MNDGPARRDATAPGAVLTTAQLEEAQRRSLELSASLPPDRPLMDNAKLREIWEIKRRLAEDDAAAKGKRRSAA